MAHHLVGIWMRASSLLMLFIHCCTLGSRLTQRIRQCIVGTSMGSFCSKRAPPSPELPGPEVPGPSPARPQYNSSGDCLTPVVGNHIRPRAWGKDTPFEPEG